MKTTRKTWLTPLFLGLAMGGIALPALALDASSWSILDEKDSVLQTDVCRIATSNVKSALKVEVSMALPKNADALPIVYLKVARDPSLTEGLAFIQTAKKEQQPLFRLGDGTQPGDSDIYWYVPKNQAHLIELMKGSKSLVVTFNPKTSTPIPAEIALSGSSAAFDKASKCLKGKDVSGSAFLTFLNASGNLGTVLPDGVTAQTLFTMVQDSYKSYLSGKTATVALAALHKQMTPLLNKESAAQKVVNGKQATLDKSQAKLDASNAQLTSLQAKLAQLTTELPTLQATVVTNQADYTAKKATYDPVKAQISPLEKEVSRKSSDLDSANSDLSNARSAYAEAQNQIANLSSRASQLNSSLPSVQSSLYSANNALSSAQSDYSRFNVDWETRREMQSNGAESAQRDAEQKRSRARDVASHYDQVLNNARQAQSELQSCVAIPGKNCSSENSRAQQGVAEEASVFQDRKRAESDADWAESNAQNLCRQAEDHARSRQNELQNCVSQAQSRVNDLQSQYNSMSSELSNIQNALPSWQNRLSSSRSEISQATQEKSAAESALAASRQALAALKAQLNYDAIALAYTTAGTVLATSQKAVTTNQATTVTTQKSIKTTTDSIAQQVPVVAKQTADRDTAQIPLTAIQTQLAPSRVQETDLNKTIDGSKSLLAINRDLYQQETAKLTGDL